MSERHTHASAHGRPKWPVRAMVTCALLTAVSVVLARFLIPTPNEVTRFSLEAVPIFLAGMLFGPLPGALTGFAADFIGCLFSPYGYNPIFCVPPILYGLCAGLFRPWLTRRCSPLRLALAFLSCRMWRERKEYRPHCFGNRNTGVSFLRTGKHQERYEV